MKFLCAMLVALPVMVQTANTNMDLTIKLTTTASEADMAKNTGGWIEKAVAAALKPSIGVVVVTPKKVGATMIKAATTTAKKAAATTTKKAAATTTAKKAAATTTAKKAAATTTAKKAAATTTAKKAAATTTTTAKKAAATTTTTAKKATTTTTKKATTTTTKKATTTTTKKATTTTTKKASGRRLATLNIVVAVAVPTAKVADYKKEIAKADFAGNMKTQMAKAAPASFAAKITAGSVATVISAPAPTTKAAVVAKNNNSTAAPSDGAYHVSIWPVIGVLLMALSGSYLN
jgi:cobalamin biosynthesis Mg chelatase CobN